MHNHLKVKENRSQASTSKGSSLRASRVDYTRADRVNTWIRFRLSLDRGSVLGVPDFGFDWLGFQGKRLSSINIRALEDAIAEDLKVYKSFFLVSSVSVQPLSVETGMAALRITIEYNFSDENEINQCQFDYTQSDFYTEA